MSKNLDYLDCARELGLAIVESSEYKNLVKSEEDYINDLELKKNIDELEKIKKIYAISKNSSEHEIQMYLTKIRELESNISNNKTMNDLISNKQNFDKLLKKINNLISYITDEESRININSSKGGCSSCSGCGCGSK